MLLPIQCSHRKTCVTCSKLNRLCKPGHTAGRGFSMATSPLTKGRFAWAVGASMVLALVAILLLPLVGSTSIDFHRAWPGPSPDKQILFDARLPRVLLAALAGGALATSGVLFQALLRDSLADPHTLGVASGASLGAVFAICLHLPGVWRPSMFGAGVNLLLVMTVAGRGRRLSSFTT